MEQEYSNICRTAYLLIPSSIHVILDYTRLNKLAIEAGGLALSDGEHKPFRGRGTSEDHALRDKSLSAGVMVKRGR